MADNYFGSICLSDIPKELITVGKNGKKYLSVVVNQRREVGQYGHTHYIKAYAKKGAVASDVNLYIGELKPSEFEEAGGQQGATQKRTAAPPPQQADGLPF